MSRKRLRWTHHLLFAGALLVLAFGVIVARNWTTFALIYDNVTAMSEGEQVARHMRYPKDLLTYIENHPASVSLVAYDVGAEAEGIFYRADAPRPVVSVSNLMLLAEYARRTADGRLDPTRRVPIDSLDLYVLPGAGADRHRRARAHWRDQGYLDADSTVALRHVVRAVAQFGDRAATDWLIAQLGRDHVDRLPARFGMAASDAPRPSSGMHLSWNHHATTGPVAARLASLRSMSPEAYGDRVYRLTQALRTDTTFRRQERERLSQRGTDLSLRHQRALAQATYPHGTATAYAGWMARLAQGASASDTASAYVQRQLEQTIATDSVQATATTIASKAGALPGLVSFVGYVRRENGHPPRVMALFMEDLPIAVFYHLMQTGLDRGFQLQLLTDEAFFQEARARLHGRTVATWTTD
jgi:beta-lactamase class A